MGSIRKRKKQRSVFWDKLFLLLGVVMIILILIPLSKNLTKKSQVDKEIAELEKEIDDLGIQNKNWDNLIEYLESDAYLEEQARLSMGFKKPGEEVVVIKKQDANRVVVVDPEVERRNNLSNQQKWWLYFFDKK